MYSTHVSLWLAIFLVCEWSCVWPPFTFANPSLSCSSCQLSLDISPPPQKKGQTVAVGERWSWRKSLLKFPQSSLFPLSSSGSAVVSCLLQNKPTVFQNLPPLPARVTRLLKNFLNFIPLLLTTFFCVEQSGLKVKNCLNANLYSIISIFKNNFTNLQN